MRCQMRCQMAWEARHLPALKVSAMINGVVPSHDKSSHGMSPAHRTCDSTVPAAGTKHQRAGRERAAAWGNAARTGGLAGGGRAWVTDRQSDKPTVRQTDRRRIRADVAGDAARLPGCDVRGMGCDARDGMRKGRPAGRLERFHRRRHITIAAIFATEPATLRLPARANGVAGAGTRKAHQETNPRLHRTCRKC